MSLAALRSSQEWVARFGESRKSAALTIGNFDGMHLGHQEILRRVTAQARETRSLAAVLTFFPHPVRVLRPSEAPPLLMTLDQRLAAFAAAGLEAALVLPFNKELSLTSPDEFVREYLVRVMRARRIFIGENFRFGHQQKGDVKTLASLGGQLGFEVEVVSSLTIDGSVVSSTAVRKAITEGRMEDAARLLGRPYALQGEVWTGTGQGQKLVVPTLNLKTEQEMLPRTGVYVTTTRLASGVYASITNVGRRPTFNGEGITVESNLFDFSETLRSGSMQVEFLSRLRDERKFADIGALREQVLSDIETAKEFHRQKRT
jgi:riboflavin kinase/FMN adenylyltransferase